MKIINAFWERKNLGINAYEVEFENGDEIETFVARINDLADAEYIVAKLPIGNLGINKIFTDIGFMFAECIIKIGINVNDYIIPAKLKKINLDISYTLADYESVNFICGRIEENIFNTDRVALDSAFGLKLANKRYSNWIKDEFNNNSSSIYTLKFKRNNIGFFGLKKKSEHGIEIFLAGIFNEFKEFGLGFGMISKSIEAAQNLGFNYIYTHISSNNFEVLRLYMQLGFSPLGIKNIFIKNFNNKNNE
jgi:ribosomal protein S18 acetylase RimI-like enzyme